MQDLIRSLESAPDLINLTNRFQRMVAPFGFDGFAAGCLRDGDKPVTMFLQRWPPAWAREYMANGYGAEDPLIPVALASPETLTWDELWARGPYRSTRPVVAAFAFGWRDGLVVPVHGPGERRGIVSLAARRMTMPAAKRPEVEALCRAAYARGQTLSSAGAGPNLTPREREVLALVATGHDDAEIAGTLGIAKATAHAHVERAKRRLGARSRAQATAIAAANGLI